MSIQRMTATPLPGSGARTRANPPVTGTGRSTNPSATPLPGTGAGTSSNPPARGSTRGGTIVNSPVTPLATGFQRQRSQLPSQHSRRHPGNIQQQGSGELSALLQPIRELQQEQKKLQGMCTSVVESQNKVLTIVEELKALINEQTKKNFTVKGTAFELPLRKELANLYCRTLTRYPSTEDIRRAIRKALPREEIEKKYVAEACLKEANTILSTFRTEERRRVLGSKPVEQLSKLSTASLAANVIDYLKASATDETISAIYIKHLTLLRLFIRENPDTKERKNFHAEFRKWVATFYSNITEDQWADIISADESHDYHLYPTELAPRNVDPPSDQGSDGHDQESLDDNIPDVLPDANPEAYLFDSN